MASAWARSSSRRVYTRSTWACSMAISARLTRGSDTHGSLTALGSPPRAKNDSTRWPGRGHPCPGHECRASSPHNRGVTRIVAGTAGGRRLKVPPKGTRPTSERVREALFNALETAGELDGAHVLDLYAGSGALGLEALSRGAADALFVESDRRAAGVLRRNVSDLGLGGEVVVGAAGTVLARLADRGFDVVL